MNSSLLTPIGLSALLLPMNLAHGFDSEIEAIKAQEGCFEVTFQYEEVEGHAEDYKLKPPSSSSVIEWVSVDYESETQVVLQHVLVTRPRIKHWKQIWTHEGREFDVYTSPNQWERRSLSEEEAAGQWVQEVRGVADNPRYACSGTWQLDDGASWTCQTWAAKPRRDEDRADYNVLMRTNTHRIHDAGWVHEQRNTKLQVDPNQASAVVTEIGNNTYDRIDDSHCEKTAAWWTKRRATWDQVQRAWDDVSQQHPSYEVTARKGLFPLWVRLFWLARSPVAERKYERIYKRATRIIERHLKGIESSGHDVPYLQRPAVLESVEPSDPKEEDLLPLLEPSDPILEEDL